MNLREFYQFDLKGSSQYSSTGTMNWINSILLRWRITNVALTLVIMLSVARSSSGTEDRHLPELEFPVDFPLNFPVCPEIKVQQNFDVKKYMTGTWYAQQQAETWWLSKEYFYCVRADYAHVLYGPTEMGYSYLVNNRGQDVNGVRTDVGFGFCAYEKEGPAKLALAPCHLPKIYATPYWVVAYKEGPAGYSLVIGGAPTIPDDDGSGRCSTGDKGDGFWIYTRAKKRNEAVIEEVRRIAATKGLDTRVLYDVKQEGCKYDD